MEIYTRTAQSEQTARSSKNRRSSFDTPNAVLAGTRRAWCASSLITTRFRPLLMSSSTSRNPGSSLRAPRLSTPLFFGVLNSWFVADYLGNAFATPHAVQPQANPNPTAPPDGLRHGRATSWRSTYCCKSS
jgi:hypothetical protein